MMSAKRVDDGKIGELKNPEDAVVGIRQESEQGLFETFLNISKKANIRDLYIILMTALEEPLSIDSLVSLVSDEIPRSTAYRRISELIRSGIITKTSKGTVIISESFRIVHFWAQMHKKMKFNGK